MYGYKKNVRVKKATDRSRTRNITTLDRVACAQENDDTATTIQRKRTIAHGAIIYAILVQIFVYLVQFLVQFSVLFLVQFLV